MGSSVFLGLGKSGNGETYKQKGLFIKISQIIVILISNLQLRVDVPKNQCYKKSLLPMYSSLYMYQLYQHMICLFTTILYLLPVTWQYFPKKVFCLSRRNLSNM